MHSKPTRLIRERGGFTMVEVMIACLLLFLVILATVALFGSTCRLWRVGTSATNANTYGSLAMRRLVTEVQEGQAASASGTHLRIQYPYYDAASGSYHKSVPGEVVDYYLSGDTGTEAPDLDAENSMWKLVGGNRTRIARNLRSFEFIITSQRLVRLCIKGSDSEGAHIDPDLIQQSVTLRNN